MTHTHMRDTFKLNEDLVPCMHPFVAVAMDSMLFEFITDI